MAAWAAEVAPAEAQSDDETGRIVARRLDDGRTEFGWQPTGGERVLPTGRYFPTSVAHQRWLRSTPVEVEGVAIGQINARMLADGRIEFGFTPTDGERILTDARYFPTDARVGRWLRSTEITIGAASATGFVAISAGGGHACAIRAGSGAIECWGWNDTGQTDAPTGSFTAVSSGAGHSCAIRESGAIECWGSNHDWQEIYRGQATPPAGSFTAVSAGQEHTCAIRESGAIECWGSNIAYRPVAVRESEEEALYEAIPAGQTDAPVGAFRAVAAGSSHSCGVRSDGAIECWGKTEDDGRTDAPAGAFRNVSVGVWHTCGLRESGAIECWGWNGNGEATPPAGNFTAVSAGVFHTCGLRESGAIECWGSNEAGQLDAPTGRFTAIEAGGSHTCALRESGAIACWGRNDEGQTDAPAP